MNSRPSPTPSPSLPQTASFDLELTIISAKHLKNVNWKSGPLKPYAIFWVDPDNAKLTTKSDESGSTKPVWNQRFLIPVTASLMDSAFHLEIFHSRAAETPKPFVGSVQVRLSDLPDPNNGNMIRTYDILRPSGRPQGKIRLKMAIKEHPLPVPDYQTAPPTAYYYSSAPPYPSPSPYAASSVAGSGSRSAVTPVPHGVSQAYPYSVGYYAGYYPPPPLPRSFSDRFSVPSAPVEYGQPGSRGAGLGTGLGLGVGTGVAVGAVAGGIGGMTLDEGLKYEEAKAEENLGAARDDLSDYRVDY